jgi:hypothetical protein
MNNFLKLSIIGASVLMFGGCKKFVDINENPNTPTSTRAQWVFTGAQGTTYRNQVSQNVNFTTGTWAGYYAHSTSFTGGAAEKTYEFTNADFTGTFEALYDNLYDYQFVKDNADRDAVPFWKSPADVMQCYVFQQLVDLYGDVPYTQALKGIANIQPTYTPAQTIYEDLVVRLDSAMARMGRETWPTATDITQQDVIFQGNRTNWIRFANTLKLRILMRQSFMTGGRDAYIQTNINNTKALGYIAANVLVSPGYQVIAGKLNPFYAFGYNEINTVQSNYQFRKMNQVMMHWLLTTNSSTAVPPSPPPSTSTPTSGADTFRLNALAYPAGTTPVPPATLTASGFKGVPLGAGSGYSTATTSPVGPLQVQIGQGTRPALFVLLAEALFLQAEAAERWGITFTAAPSAQALYEAGILAHFRTCAGISPTAANLGNVANTGDAFAIRYYNRPKNNVNYVASTDKVRAILIQKWTSLCHINGLEAWSEYRKSNNTPQTATPYSPETFALTSNTEPVRFLYPLSEINVNPNAPRGINQYTSKIFWDVN